jgi:hypothetical protein
MDVRTAATDGDRPASERPKLRLVAEPPPSRGLGALACELLRALAGLLVAEVRVRRVRLMPCYWVLHSIAAWRALGRLITKPSHWEKTPHGLSKHGNQGAGAPTSEEAFAAVSTALPVAA